MIATISSPMGRQGIFLWTVFLSLLVSTIVPGLSEELLGAFARERRQMVERDLEGRGITAPRVIEAMSTVPRHLFVAESYRSLAYGDHPLPIGAGQTISQPYLVGLMTQLLELKGEERVLEVGTGSGYQAAVLSHMAKEVYSIEIIPALAKGARERLARLGYKNVHVKTGDGFFGWEEKGPFDAIVVTASATKIPDPLWSQLREGGRLVIPLGMTRRSQQLVRARKVHGRPRLETVTGVLFVPMTGEVEDRLP